MKKIILTFAAFAYLSVGLNHAFNMRAITPELTIIGGAYIGAVWGLRTLGFDVTPPQFVLEYMFTYEARNKHRELVKTRYSQ